MEIKRKNINDFLKKVDKNNILSDSFNIFEIFGEDHLFKIKSFQRKYTWSTKQIEDLINDIEEYEYNTNFFLGTIIIKKSKNNGKIEYSIVDGQQRITTLFLILKSVELKIRNEDLKEKSLNYEKIRNLYLLKNGKEEKLKIEGYRSHTNELENILKSNSWDDIEKIEKNDLIVKNYLENILKINNMDFLKDYEKIKKFIEKINKVTLSIILLGNDIDENKVFEDLNSKGSPLLIEDLLRNYFYKKAKQIISENGNLKNYQVEKKIKEVMEKYETTIYELEHFLTEEKKYRSLFTNKINRFFKNYILFRINNANRLNEDNDRRMFMQYKKEMTNKIESLNELKKELVEIDKYFKFCKFMANYNKVDNDHEKIEINNEKIEINNEKYLLNSLEFYPFIYAFYSEWTEKSHNLIILFSTIVYTNLLVKREDIWKFLKKNMSQIKEIALDSYYEKNNKKDDIKSALSSILYPEEHKINPEFNFLKRLKEDMKNRISDDSDVYKSYEFKRFLQYYFALINKPKKIMLVDKKYNLEHIISRKTNWDKYKEKDKNEIILISKIDKIENLCLIEKEINNTFSNLIFREKVEIYKKFVENKKRSEIKQVNYVFNEKWIGNVGHLLNSRKEILKNESDNFVDYIYMMWESSL